MSKTGSVVLNPVGWATYEKLRCDLEETAASRMNYDRGTLEIMSPSPRHERMGERLSDIVRTLTEEWEMEIDSLGNATFQRADLERGFEPDACFYIQHLADIADKDEIDLTIDPAPDLVIEIDITSPSLDKMPLYAQVGVAEVWRWQNNRTLSIFTLENGVYQASEESRVLPPLTLTELQDFLTTFRPGRRGEWLRTLRQWAKRHPVSG